MMRVTAVIPCLNEAAAIGRVVREVRELVPDVVVVDDGSTDETGSEALAAGAEVLRHDSSQGKGAALAAGFAAAHARGAEWVLALDGDGQHAAADIPRFLTAAAGGQCGMIVGNRMASVSSMPWLRRQVNRWMSGKLSRLSGRALPDTQCGFRMIRLADWARLKPQFCTRNFEVESEMLLAFARAGVEIEFVPVEVIYKAEQSKIHPVRDTLRWFRWLWTVK